MSKALIFWRMLEDNNRNVTDVRDKLCNEVGMTRSWISTVLNGNTENRIYFKPNNAKRFLKSAIKYNGGEHLVLADIPHRVK